MGVVAESEDRESVTEVVLASRERVIRQLHEMNRDLLDMRKKIDDSDWPPPPSDPSYPPASVPPSPPPSERH